MLTVSITSRFNACYTLLALVRINKYKTMKEFKISCSEMRDNEELFCISVNDIVKIYPFKKQIMYKGNLTNTVSTILNARLSDSENSNELRKWDLPMMVDYMRVTNFKLFDLRITVTKTKLANGWSRI